MKNFMNEFKKFICRGNVMDMAVGVIIGGAFTAIVTSLVNDVINPLLGIFGGMNFDQLVWNVNGAEIAYGKFITAVINFLIMALIIFGIVRTMNKLSDKYSKKEEPAAPTTKKCPYCKSDIALDATRCPHCTSQLD
ncbi:MAG: large conductance mechanosensitive channel protein MscL [Lachnospiraceae bacterium]|nr:large conductance mechanosensitive channel protein MscL [Lachnospiraceae bacterium]